ncbi:DivIVA domain-containing protein [Galactobacter valiniphilus]|uniref:Cell wall synthesis protein Wag31 n=1 Tax=Galactobacter valiniphilus TaxID=2676122 RepID=A0A399JFJ6_9MICC|nr:DivIVA domain-containing protein [Galactobacter valiniphilus]RII42969.1 DivIVA domain-containing protein [Galactobacter valiniphilus]
MALTPDDVVNKRFQPTKFREGYDQDEVDDFLDEVVEELRRLNKENDELRVQLADCQAGKPVQAAEPVPAPVAAVPEAAAEEPKAEEPEVKEAAPVAEPAPVAAPVVSAPVAPAAAAAPAASSAENAAGVLAMAQKLHDEYVTAGATERDRLVGEAQDKAAGLVSEAEAAARKTTQDAEETKRKTLAELERQKSGLETQIEKLRGFERDYRSRLRTYIQGQLKDLESAAMIGDESSSAN